MSGALINLVAKGVQNAFLDINSIKNSLFRSRFSRISNFSQAPAQLPVVGKIAPGGRSSIEILKKGDIINGLWIETADAYTTLIGSTFDLYIGGKLIDSQTVDYSADIWQVYLAENSSKSSAVNNATSASDSTFYPFHFFFCDNKQFLPLVNLQYQEVEIIVKWGSGVSASTDLKCYGNFVYLDTTEREAFAQKTMDMMITQVQKIESTNSETFDISSLNHPVKTLFWGYQSKSEDVEDDYLTFDGAKIQLNGTDLMPYMTPTYYHTIQGYYGTTNALINLVDTENCPFYTRYYMYSFATDSSDFNNRGTCNFSRLDSAILRINNLQKAPVRTSDTLNIYALGFNVLRFQSGLAGILFSN